MKRVGLLQTSRKSQLESKDLGCSSLNSSSDDGVGRKKNTFLRLLVEIYVYECFSDVPCKICQSIRALSTQHCWTGPCIPSSLPKKFKISLTLHTDLGHTHPTQNVVGPGTVFCIVVTTQATHINSQDHFCGDCHVLNQPIISSNGEDLGLFILSTHTSDMDL